MKIRIPRLSLMGTLLAILAVLFDVALADSPSKGVPIGSKAVPAAHPATTVVKDPSPGIRTLPTSGLKTQGPAGGPSATGAIQAPVLASCATGFNKTGEHKQVQTGALDSFECTTPIITCPHNPVFPNVSLEVEIISTNPEQTAKRIRYTCTYYPAVP